jgi:hypothetical protein
MGVWGSSLSLFVILESRGNYISFTEQGNLIYFTISLRLEITENIYLNRFLNETLSCLRNFGGSFCTKNPFVNGIKIS